MNKVILMGRLTRDPEVSRTAGGINFVRFTIAVNRRFKNENGEYQADFINCVAWRQTAGFIARYFVKGAMISVAGSIQTGSYQKDGQTVYTTNVNVEEAYFSLISKKEDAFDMKSLNDDIAEQQRKAEIYEGAVTQRGQDVYNDAVDRLEELQHQKEIKELQQEQTKVVSGLRDDLEAAEKYKKQILNSADAHLIDINAIAQSINSGTTGTQDILRALLSAVKNINGGVIYGDTNYNITGADTSLLAAFERRGARAISGF